MPPSATVAEPSRFTLHQEIQQGVPFQAFERLRTETGLTQGELLDVLDIPKRTFERRRKTGRFDTAESERIVRLQRLVALARDVFDGDEGTLRSWLGEPNVALGDLSPLDLASTGPGAREVEELLLRIESGVHS